MAYTGMNLAFQFFIRQFIYLVIDPSGSDVLLQKNLLQKRIDSSVFFC